MKNENLTTKESFALAVQNHQKNNLKIAEYLYREILKINPNHASAHNNLGIALNEFCDNFSISYDVLAVSFYSKQVAIKLMKN